MKDLLTQHLSLIHIQMCIRDRVSTVRTMTVSQTRKQILYIQIIKTSVQIIQKNVYKARNIRQTHLQLPVYITRRFRMHYTVRYKCHVSVFAPWERVRRFVVSVSPRSDIRGATNHYVPKPFVSCQQLVISKFLQVASS